jgi:hypothetical protein
MNGREKCALFRQMRSNIAKSNGIVYLSSECDYKVDCEGTCAICDAENRYLESELNRKVLSGESINISGMLEMMSNFIEGCDAETGNRICAELTTRYWTLSLDDLDLSVRSYNCLKRAGLTTLGDVVNIGLEGLSDVRHLNAKCLREIIEKLRYFGFEFENSEEKLLEIEKADKEKMNFYLEKTDEL